jgi:hypothetical protein
MPGAILSGEHNVPDETELPELTHTTTLLYKARTGELKELQIVQPLNPDQRKLDYTDIQLLGREIAKVLREDT